MLKIGQISAEYPHGYGFCQCGCGEPTRMLKHGMHAMYVNAGHHPKLRSPKLLEVKQALTLAKVVSDDPDDAHLALLDKYQIMDSLTERYFEMVVGTRRLERHVELAQVELESAKAFIERHWSGEPNAKRILLDRLESLLDRNEAELDRMKKQSATPADPEVEPARRETGP